MSDHASVPVQEAAPIRFILPIRDMLQSLYGGRIPHDVIELLAIFKNLEMFNDAGPVKIAGIEGHGGALPEYDVRQNRWPLRIARHITDFLGSSLVQRPLIRGPFGVTLDAKEYSDLKNILTSMAEAGGAREGKRVVFKLFEAQNRPEEYLDSLKIITELRKEGFNVACEVAMVVSDAPGLDVAYYEKTANQLLDAEWLKTNGVDPAAIAGFSLKDMIGGIHASKPGDSDITINAQNLARVAMRAIQAFADATGQRLYMGWHMHEIGNGTDAMNEATTVFANERQKYAGVTELQVDVLPGSPDPTKVRDFGFVDLEKLLERLVAAGVCPDMSAMQKAIWKDFKGHLLQLHERCRHFYIDVAKWPKALLEFGKLASGGLPYVEANGIKPYLGFLARQSGPDGQPIGAVQADKIMRCLFVSVNGLIASDLGDAHSVTPAMKLLNDLTINVLGFMLQQPEFQSLLQQKLGEGHNWDEPVCDAASQAFFRKNYDKFSNAKAMAYFCTPMPRPLSNDMLNLLRQKLFDAHFPETYEKLQQVKANNSASMLIHLSESQYLELRQQLRGCLTDKASARQLLLPYGIDAQKVEDFVATHIGVNERSVSYGVKARFAQLFSAVEDEVANILARVRGAGIASEASFSEADMVAQAGFASAIVRPKPGERLPAQIPQTMFGSATKTRQKWVTRQSRWKEHLAQLAAR